VEPARHDEAITHGRRHPEAANPDADAAHRHADAYPHADTDTDADTDAHADSDAHADTDPDPAMRGRDR
jgi:hypothetical protein